MSQNNKSLNQKKFDKIFESYQLSQGRGVTSDIEQRIKKFQEEYRKDINKLGNIIGEVATYTDNDFNTSGQGNYLSKRRNLEAQNLEFGDNILFDGDHEYNHQDWLSNMDYMFNKSGEDGRFTMDKIDTNVISWKTINPFSDNIGSPQSLVEFFFNMMMCYRSELVKTKELGNSPSAYSDWFIPLPTEWTRDDGILDKMMRNGQNKDKLKKYGISLATIPGLLPDYVPNNGFYIWDGNNNINRTTCFENGGVIIPFLLPTTNTRNNWKHISTNIYNQNNYYDYVNDSESIFGSAVGQTDDELGCIPIYVSRTSPELSTNHDYYSPVSAYITHKNRLLYDIIYSQGIYNILDPSIYGNPGTPMAGVNVQRNVPRKGKGFVNNGGILFNYSNYNNNNIPQLDLINNHNINVLPPQSKLDTELIGGRTDNGENFDRRMYKRWDTGRTFYNTMILENITNPKSNIDGVDNPTPDIKPVTNDLIQNFNDLFEVGQEPLSNMNNQQKLNLFLFDNGLLGGRRSNHNTPQHNLQDYAKFVEIMDPVGLFSVYNNNDGLKLQGNIRYIQEDTILDDVQIENIIDEFVNQIFIPQNNINNDMKALQVNTILYKDEFKSKLLNAIITVKESLFINDITEKFDNINIYKNLTTPLYDNSSQNLAVTNSINDRSKHKTKGQHIPIASTNRFKEAFKIMMNKAILTLKSENYDWTDVDHNTYNPNDTRLVVTSSGGDLSKLVKLDVSSILEMKLDDEKNISFMHYLRECLDSKKSTVNNIAPKPQDVGGFIQNNDLEVNTSRFNRFLRHTLQKKMEIMDKLRNIEDLYVYEKAKHEFEARMDELNELKTILDDQVFRPILVGRKIDNSTINDVKMIIYQRIKSILDLYSTESTKLKERITRNQNLLKTGYRTLQTADVPEEATKKSLVQLKSLVKDIREDNQSLKARNTITTKYLQNLMEDLMKRRDGRGIPGVPSPFPQAMVNRAKEVGKIVDEMVEKIYNAGKKVGLNIRLPTFGNKLEKIYYFLDDIRDSINFNIGGPIKRTNSAEPNNLDSVGLWVLYSGIGSQKLRNTNLFDLLSGRRITNIQNKAQIDQLYKDDKLYGVIIGQTEQTRQTDPGKLFYVGDEPPKDATYKTPEGREQLIKYMKNFFGSYPSPIGQKGPVAAVKKYWRTIGDSRKQEILDNFRCVNWADCKDSLFITKEAAKRVLEQLIDLSEINPDTKLMMGGGKRKLMRKKKKKLVVPKKVISKKKVTPKAALEKTKSKKVLIKNNKGKKEKKEKKIAKKNKKLVYNK